VAHLRWAPVAALLALVAGCGSAAAPRPGPLTIDLQRTRPAGLGRAFRPPAIGNASVVAGAPVGGMRCGRAAASPYGAHIELFALGRGIVVPAGIGIAPPERRAGPFVVGGRCVYALRTTAPTGVVDVDPAAWTRPPTVGELFELWGQPLSRWRLGSFVTPGRTPVVAFVDGRRWAADPRAIPLRRHAQIELELGQQLPPHPAYLFPAGL
jgi:hypothetical protein